MLHKEPVRMVLPIGNGKRLLNVREAAQYLGLEVDTRLQESQVAGGSLSQGWSSVAVRRESARALHRTAHNRNH